MRLVPAFFAVALTLASCAFAGVDQIRSRVIDSAVMLEIKWRDTGGLDNNKTDHLFPVKRETNGVRCSGTILKHGDKAYILSAAHCFEGAKRERTESEDGKERKIVEYDDANFVVPVVKNGRKVGEIHGLARPIAVGKVEEQGGDDLALLELYDSEMGRGDARLLPSSLTYDVGTDVYNCSTLWGEYMNSLLRGIISVRGYIYENRPFDTSDVSVRPGSSGSGLHVMVKGAPYLAGVVTRWDGRGAFAMAVPIERIRSWLNKTGHADLLSAQP